MTSIKYHRTPAGAVLDHDVISQEIVARTKLASFQAFLGYLMKDLALYPELGPQLITTATTLMRNTVCETTATHALTLALRILTERPTPKDVNRTADAAWSLLDRPASADLHIATLATLNSCLSLAPQPPNQAPVWASRKRLQALRKLGAQHENPSVRTLATHILGKMGLTRVTKETAPKDLFQKNLG